MIKSKWVVQGKSANFREIAKEFHIDQVTARLLRNREINTRQQIEMFLHGGLEQLHDGSLMKGMKEGVTLLKEKIAQGKEIRVIGDYDIDGVTATYILCEGITRCGGIVSESIPDRVTDGYGLNVRLIQEAGEDGVDTIITCDNGIAAKDAIAVAKELSMTVIVTDHHNVPYSISPQGETQYIDCGADVTIDPKQWDCEYPFKEICGAVVAFKFIEQLCKACDMEKNEFEELRNHLLMYAAIGTVGDIMDLQDENRIIVKEGLKLIRRTEDTSLCALIDACGISRENLSAYHIGYILGPCINASGRLQTAEYALKLLRSKDKKESEALATKLVALNEERKKLTEEYTKQAVDMIETTSLMNDKVLVVYLPECHESIAGIIAGRIRERFVKPTMVVTKTVHGLKGSGRSIDAYPMYDEMTKVSDCFTKFGGHALAAGFSLEENRLEELRARLNEGCKLTEDDFVEKVLIDVPMPMDYVTMPLVEEFELLRPYGKGNPSPLFAQKDVEIISARIIGRERKFMKFKFRTDCGNFFEGIYFESPEVFEEFLIEKFDYELARDIMSGKQTKTKISVCYVPEINEYANNRTLQMQVKYVS